MGAAESGTGSGRTFWRRMWWALAISGAVAAIGLAAVTRDLLYLFLPAWGAGTKVIFGWDDTRYARDLAETALIWAVITAWLAWREGGALWSLPFMLAAFLAVAGGHAIAVLRYMAMQENVDSP
ncbi:hypothetical protein [Limnochorda pilosa]|uniref:Uncharacterized protein n=1 Tax=Limnochorda pilosa TaxID=1555112 RepID=A0A0K2SH78_LIMPI|nr:hypothetical protein [Limnochorda pilosa]BAS26392.1 hypothetical protein LIP_0535 [Limnochorda pilosa]